MIELKLALLLAVLAAGALGGALPLRRGRAGARLLGLGNAFGAGVFLGAGLVHMLPDAVAASSALGWEYPVSYLLAAVAFVVLLLFEHVLLPEHAHEMVHAPSSQRFSSLPGEGHGGFAAYAALTALSIHSLLEGLALGAQPDVAGALVVFVAILAHKSSSGFALGVSLVRSNVSPAQAWGLLAVFSLATPLGILVGTLLDESLENESQLALQATLLALAAGTFAYVATVDILRDEFLEPGGRWSKWLLVAVGTGAMALLALWV